LKPFEGIISLILRHLFSPLNNTRLSHLCGPMDAHLRSIETALQVKIAHRHEQFKVDGTKAQAGAAQQSPHLAPIELHPGAGHY
jgi:phosphate starvation-inducible PhoH-like protein